MEAYECSSKGDKRFSAYYARIKCKDNRSIEDLYQVELKGYSSIKDGKGKPGLRFTYEEQRFGYENIWVKYLQENPDLMYDLLEISKTHVLTDMFSKPNSINQADALTSILNKIRKEDLYIMSRKKMSEVKDGGGGYITEAGEFEMEILEVKEELSSNGNVQYNIKLSCDEGIVYDRVTMVEKAMGFVKRYLSACGYDIDDLEYEVEDNGKKKGMVTQLYFEDKEYSLIDLLEEETVLVTTVEGDSSYKDPTDGTIHVVDNPSAKVKNVEYIEEEE